MASKNEHKNQCCPMDLSNVVCLHKFYPESLFDDDWSQCLQLEHPLFSNTSMVLPTVVVEKPLQTCAIQQIATCFAQFSNLTISFPSIHLGSYSPSKSLNLQSADPAHILFHLGVKLLMDLFHLAITIPFRVFLWIISSLMFQMHQFCIDLFVHPKLQSFLVIICLILIAALVRRKMSYWSDKNIPFECFTAHLQHFRPFSRFLPLDDVSRVRRHGRLFG